MYNLHSYSERGKSLISFGSLESVQSSLNRLREVYRSQFVTLSPNDRELIVSLRTYFIVYRIEEEI